MEGGLEGRSADTRTENGKKAVLLHYFPLLPPQMLASAFATLHRCSSIARAAISADLNEKPTLLRNGFLNRISNRQFPKSPMMLRITRSKQIYFSHQK